MNLTEKFEHDQKLTRTKNDLMNLTGKFSQRLMLSPYMTIEVEVFVTIAFIHRSWIVQIAMLSSQHGIKKIIWSNSIAFGQAQQINVRRCQFSVMF